MSGAEQNRGIGRFAALTATATLVLILAGGFVTTTRTGDTVPTWPKSWGTFYVGAWVELTHRYLAATIGLLVGGLAFVLQAREPRAWVRRIAWTAFGAVVAQALLGGIRIFTDRHGFPLPKAPVAIVHACFGQAVFCAMVAIALFVSESWTRVAVDATSASARRWGVLATFFAFLQLVAGAVTRHTGAGLAVHLAGAVGVLLFVTLFASRLMMTPVRRGALLLMGILGLQIALGIATWAITAGGFERSIQAPLYQIATVSAHVAVGAALLATSLGVTLMCHRGTEPAAASLEGARA
jgi:cytochrome c oxidase assembly protein subunit 15